MSCRSARPCPGSRSVPATRSCSTNRLHTWRRHFAPGRREDEQAEALSGLSADRAHVESSATSLHEALVRHSARPPGLRVFALGPLRVERGGEAIERWGGEKAGTRQAQALFAFLFDRGERGVAKDEALELIWPDTDVDRADLAFHRTLGGLRHTLDPDDGSGKHGIRFHNDRYRLDPGIIDWSDVAMFLARLDQARVATERTENLRLLEEARMLYRGEYLDDCPFYGDSVYVEDRRASFRGRSIDVLVALGEGLRVGRRPRIRGGCISRSRRGSRRWLSACLGRPGEAGHSDLRGRLLRRRADASRARMRDASGRRVGASRRADRVDAVPGRRLGPQKSAETFSAARRLVVDARRQHSGRPAVASCGSEGDDTPADRPGSPRRGWRRQSCWRSVSGRARSAWARSPSSAWVPPRWRRPARGRSAADWHAPGWGSRRSASRCSRSRRSPSMTCIRAFRWWHWR